MLPEETALHAGDGLKDSQRYLDTLDSAGHSVTRDPSNKHNVAKIRSELLSRT